MMLDVMLEGFNRFYEPLLIDYWANHPLNQQLDLTITKSDLLLNIASNGELLDDGSIYAYFSKILDPGSIVPIVTLFSIEVTLLFPWENNPNNQLDVFLREYHSGDLIPEACFHYVPFQIHGQEDYELHRKGIMDFLEVTGKQLIDVIYAEESCLTVTLKDLPFQRESLGEQT